MSQAHASALSRHLKSAGAHKSQTKPGQNIAVNIRCSTKDETLVGADRRPAPDADAERAYLKRKAALESNGTPRTTGKNASAFDKLRAGLRQYVRENGGAEHMAKAVPTDDGLDQAALMRQLKAGPKAAPRGSLLKSLMPSFDNAAKGLGIANPLKKSLAAGTDSNSAALTGGSALRRQSISKRVASTTVGGDPKPAPKPTLMTKSQCQAAALKAMNAGKIAPQDAQTIDTCLSMDRRIPDALMKVLRAAHEGK